MLALGGEARRTEKPDGSVARALTGGGKGPGGGVKWSNAAGVEIGDFGEAAGLSRTGGCIALVKAAPCTGGGEATSVDSLLSAATLSSASLFATGVFASTGIAVRAGASTLRGLMGRGAGSTRGVSVGGVTGLTDGQLLTPPACTVLHQGQRIGWTIPGGAGECAIVGSTGVASMAGSKGLSATPASGIFATAAETAGDAWG